jgi:cold shock CspA family protein
VRAIGKVFSVVPERGFAFVQIVGEGDTAKDIFTHFSRLKNRKRLYVDDRVEFTIGRDTKGREIAVDVVVLDEPPVFKPVAVGVAVAAETNKLQDSRGEIDVDATNTTA